MIQLIAKYTTYVWNKCNYTLDSKKNTRSFCVIKSLTATYSN